MPNNINPNESPSLYLNFDYDTKERFASYWHQINEIIKFKPKHILEVGVGNKFVSSYLKARSLEVITLDYSPKFFPDIVGNVLNIPLQDNFFDVVACYEVLEHLPYENFYKSLSELYRVSKKHVVLSLPDENRYYRFSIQLPKIGYIKKLIQLPRIKKPLQNPNGLHYWDIGRKGYSLAQIIHDIERVGFRIIDTYNVFENPWHRFFVLEK